MKKRILKKSGDTVLPRRKGTPLTCAMEITQVEKSSVSVIERNADLKKIRKLLT